MDTVAVVGLEPELHGRRRGHRLHQPHQRAASAAAGSPAPRRRIGVGEADAGGELLRLRRVVLQDFSVRRTQPMSTDIAPSTRSIPAMNSVEPPPMSTTRKGPLAGSSSPVAPRNEGAPPRRRSAAGDGCRSAPPRRRRTRHGWQRRGKPTWLRTARLDPMAIRRRDTPAGGRGPIRPPRAPGPARADALTQSVMVPRRSRSRGRRRRPAPARGSSSCRGRPTAITFMNQARYRRTPLPGTARGRSSTQRPTGSSPPARCQAKCAAGS